MSKSIEAIREALVQLANRIEERDGWPMEIDPAAADDICDLLDAHDAALSRASEVEAQTIERCALLVEGMTPKEPNCVWEAAYKTVGEDHAAAIRSMRPTESTKD